MITKTVDGRIIGRNQGEGKTEEVMDKRGARTDGDGPGVVQQSGRRQAMHFVREVSYLWNG